MSGSTSILVLQVIFLSSVQSICPEHWVKYDDTCYFHDMTPVTFKEASKKCEVFNATMISIHSSVHNNWINNFASDIPVWLGGLSYISKTKNVDHGTQLQNLTISSVTNGVDNSLPSNERQSNLTYQVAQPSRDWKWMDGSPWNYWLWASGNWFTLLPRQPDCNATCCAVVMNEVGSWSDEDCEDEKKLATTVCRLRFNDIKSTSAIEYETESKLTVSSEVTMLQKLVRYIENNYVSKMALDVRSNELIGRDYATKDEVLSKAAGRWLTPLVIILAFVILILIISNVYLFCQVKKIRLFSTINFRRFHFKTLNQNSNDFSGVSSEQDL